MHLIFFSFSPNCDALNNNLLFFVLLSSYNRTPTQSQICCGESYGNGGNRYRNQVLRIFICRSGSPHLRWDVGLRIMSVTTQKGLSFICFKSDMLNKCLYSIWFPFKTGVAEREWTKCKICSVKRQFSLCLTSSFKPGVLQVTVGVCWPLFMCLSSETAKLIFLIFLVCKLLLCLRLNHWFVILLCMFWAEWGWGWV